MSKSLKQELKTAVSTNRSRKRPKKLEKSPTKPGVFIIESNQWEDEKEGDYEGKILSRMLEMSRIEHEYYYIRTRKELSEVLTFFDDSEYRYLHLACHGDEEHLFTTLDDLTLEQFVNDIESHVSNKRLFISACLAVNDTLANKLFRRTTCISLTGPAKIIYFTDAAVIWTAFYCLMFNERKGSMTGEMIVDKLTYLSKLFNVDIRFYYAESERDLSYKRPDSFIFESRGDGWVCYDLEADNIELTAKFIKE